MNQTSLQHQSAPSTQSPAPGELCTNIALLFPTTEEATISRASCYSVKRFVRHTITRQYFKAGGWTEFAKEATVFADSLEAAHACARHGLMDVELALLGAAGFDLFSMPLR
jgi:hypothetical protein